MGIFSAEVTENYLKHIYHLSLDGGPVKTSQLAAAMELSPAAVTEMIKRLDDQSLVDYEPYHGVSLTEEGQRRALIVLRRHRLWEVFLHEVLHVPWAEVHGHAERLEHATDDVLAKYLDDFLGSPAFDPHGHPIPNHRGEVDEVARLRLTSVKPGAQVEVVQCSNEDPDLLDYLKSLGLVPGTCLCMHGQAPFNGPLTLELAANDSGATPMTCVIGAEAATTLLVRVLKEGR